jgi:hypothetical protein
VPILHPGELQVGWGVEVAHMAGQVHFLMPVAMGPRGLDSNLQGGDN